MPTIEGLTSIARATLRTVATALTLCLFGNSIAYAAKPMDPVRLQSKLAKQRVGKLIKVKQTNGTAVTGTLIAIHADSLELVPSHRARAAAITIPFASVSSVHSREGLTRVVNTSEEVALSVLGPPLITFLVACTLLQTLKGNIQP